MQMNKLKVWRGTRYLNSLKASPHKISINYKVGEVPLEWRNLVGPALIRCSKLCPPVMRPIQTTCELVGHEEESWASLLLSCQRQISWGKLWGNWKNTSMNIQPKYWPGIFKSVQVMKVKERPRTGSRLKENKETWQMQHVILNWIL